MAPSSSGAVLFDIDGTLVDSNYLHVVAWTQAFRTVKHPVDGVRIHRGVGMGSDELLDSLLGSELATTLGDRLRDEHRENYARMRDQLRPFDGARELVAAVGRRATAVLATSASSEELDALLEVLDLGSAVAAVTSAKDVEAAKPHPDLVEVALDRAGVGPDRAVFVGDTVWDVEASGRAGVTCVGVLSGGISEAELRDAGAVAVYPDAGAILADLDRSPLKAVLA